MKNKVIEVQNVQISISKQELDDYICITDIAKAKSGDSRCADIVKNWLRNRNTLEFLGTWEKIYNSDFKVVEIGQFKPIEFEAIKLSLVFVFRIGVLFGLL